MLTSSFVASLREIRALVITFAVICAIAPSFYAAKKPGFTAFIVGNAADAQPAATLSPGLVLMGGGSDVDAAFQWMCQRAGGGDFVVIRTTGTDAYNPYIQQLCPQMDSV
jgi:cyanophycinase